MAETKKAVAKATNKRRPAQRDQGVPTVRLASGRGTGRVYTREQGALYIHALVLKKHSTRCKGTGPGKNARLLQAPKAQPLPARGDVLLTGGLPAGMTGLRARERLPAGMAGMRARWHLACLRRCAASLGRAACRDRLAARRGRLSPAGVSGAARRADRIKSGGEQGHPGKTPPAPFGCRF